MAQVHGGAEWAEFEFHSPPVTSEGTWGGRASKHICSWKQYNCMGSKFHWRMLPPTQDRTPPRNKTFDPVQWPSQNPTSAANFLGCWIKCFCRKPVSLNFLAAATGMVLLISLLWSCSPFSQILCWQVLNWTLIWNRHLALTEMDNWGLWITAHVEASPCSGNRENRE